MYFMYLLLFFISLCSGKTLIYGEDENKPNDFGKYNIHHQLMEVFAKKNTVASTTKNQNFVTSLFVNNLQEINQNTLFYGIGAISGGGATSKLLMNYPKKQRDDILDFLFKPNFGASLHMLKVEIGGDSQSTEGTEASHMHNSWDLNYERGYEWWLMLEAKKRNPDILLYGLPWAFPYWVGNGTLSPYIYPQLTVDYIVKWVDGAKKVYKLDIDYLGIWNERPYNVEYVKLLRSSLDKSGYKNTKLVVGDGGWDPASDILKDPAFAAAVFAIGAHYPGTTSTPDAKKTGKPLWSSEDYSTFNNDVGSGCWARILNQNFINGGMTNTIAWNMLAAYYDNLPYGRCALMTANEPWSGHYDVAGPIWVTAHTTQFTQPGWFYLPSSGSLPSGGSFVALTNSDQNQLSIVFETMSHNHSQCIRPALPPYKVSPQNVTISLQGKLSSITSLHVWKTKLNFDGTPSTFFDKVAPIKIINGKFTIKLGVDELYTLSTITTAQKGVISNVPPSKPFPLPYNDDFDDSPLFSEPNNISPQIGSFEIAADSLTTSNHFVQQTSLFNALQWCLEPASRPIAVIGNYNWSSVIISSDVFIPSLNGSTGVFIGARVNQGGCGAYLARGVFFFLTLREQRFSISTDVVHAVILKSGRFGFKQNTWMRLSMAIFSNNTVSVEVNHKVLASNIPIPKDVPAKGFVAIGAHSYGLVNFDNFSINPPPA